MIHRLADCLCENVPDSTNIWQFCVVLPKAHIGEYCNICSHCFIEDDAFIGNYCTIKCGVQIWNGIIIEDGVFIGANVTFTNDRYPRSRNKNWTKLNTTIHKGATIGAGTTILPGLEIGENSIVGAGSVVTKCIPAGEIWVGNPARFLRKV